MKRKKNTCDACARRQKMFWQQLEKRKKKKKKKKGKIHNPVDAARENLNLFSCLKKQSFQRNWWTVKAVYATANAAMYATEIQPNFSSEQQSAHSGLIFEKIVFTFILIIFSFFWMNITLNLNSITAVFLNIIKNVNQMVFCREGAEWNISKGEFHTRLVLATAISPV